jgi:hypothetical protein
MDFKWKIIFIISVLIILFTLSVPFNRCEITTEYYGIDYQIGKHNETLPLFVVLMENSTLFPCKINSVSIS